MVLILLLTSHCLGRKDLLEEIVSRMNRLSRALPFDNLSLDDCRASLLFVRRIISCLKIRLMWREVSLLIFQIENLRYHYLNIWIYFFRFKIIYDRLFAKELLKIDEIHKKDRELLGHTDFLSY